MKKPFYLIIMSWYEFNSFVLAEADFCIVICLTALCLDSESYSFSSYFSLVVDTFNLKSVHTPTVVKSLLYWVPTLMHPTVKVLS